MLFLKETPAGYSDVRVQSLPQSLLDICCLSGSYSARQKIMSNLILFLALGHVSHLPLEAAILP